MESYKAKKRLNLTLIHIILIVMSIIMLVPFVWMILTAVKTNQEAISVKPFYIIPQGAWHWENFSKVWKSYNFLILYKNTLLMIFFFDIDHSLPILHAAAAVFDHRECPPLLF